MTTLLRSHPKNNDFIALVKLLDRELAVRDGEDHAFYDQFNKIDDSFHVVIAFENGNPIACGAIKKYQDGVMEIKRMYTVEEKRGHGIASLILIELEKWAMELSYNTCILETGVMQPEAIGLYKKNGYTLRPNYGQYEGVATSLCFEKRIPFYTSN